MAGDKNIIATLDEAEWFVLGRLRELRKRGYGDLRVECIGGIISRCLLTTGEDPAFLKALQRRDYRLEQIEIDLARSMYKIPTDHNNNGDANNEAQAAR